ncbi:hypothetical protein K501DRAFT_325759 [Backusella circina FSU 941]|nr:hypothetical protein K501DRAFT_325759 [Backusella circina FSU 941]
MNDSISILVAVFLILIALRWMLGGSPSNQQQQNQRRAPARRVHRVTPQMIETVRAMFPDIPTAAIQADLQRTGSVETTVDNALRDGGLPLPPPTPSSPSSNTGSPAGSSNRKTPNHPSLIQRYRIDETKDTVEPPKVWESSPDKRQEMLRKRKEYMVIQARKKLLDQQKLKEQKEKEQREKEQREREQQQIDDDTNTFDEMSVDQLNSLTPEQRRDQMLQALQKRAVTEQS